MHAPHPSSRDGEVSHGARERLEGVLCVAVRAVRRLVDDVPLEGHIVRFSHKAGGLPEARQPWVAVVQNPGVAQHRPTCTPPTFNTSHSDASNIQHYALLVQVPLPQVGVQAGSRQCMQHASLRLHHWRSVGGRQTLSARCQCRISKGGNAPEDVASNADAAR